MDGFRFSLGVLLVTAGCLVWIHFGLKKVRYLSQIPDGLASAPPAVSIVVSALNEADTIEPALRSLLALDYPRLEVIAIDDRSTDATGAILDRIAAEDPRLRVLHVSELPGGWLGKNNALQRGAELATGDYLLFTDADVVFEPRALRRAVHFCEEHRLDHLVVLAEFTVRHDFLAALLLDFYAFMFAQHPVWRLRTSRTAYVGMGAFNMVRASAYREAGGHTPLRLEVLDDLMLGKHMKTRGFRQDAVLGQESVALEWYRHPADMMRGLEKNSFAMFDYSIARVLGMTLVVLAGRCWPVVGLFVTSGAAWWCNLGTIGAALLLHVEVLRVTGWSPRLLWWWPVSGPAMQFILWRGVLLTIRRGGVNWRGTLYPLKELKKARAAMG